MVLLAAAQFAPGCGSSAQPATTTAVPTASQAAAAANPPPAEQKRTADDLARQREELDQTVWANEVAAQHYEAPFVRLWDNLRAARDKVAVLADFPFTELVIESPADSVSIDDGISVTSFGPPMRRMDASDWRGWLTELQATGHQLVESEWHHSNFSPAAAGKPAHSLVSFVLHVVNSGENRRFVVKGELDVEWAPPGPSASGDAPAPRPRRVEARSLRIAQRQGDVPFKQRLAIGSETTGSDPRNSLLLTVYDFNGDDRPDVALPDYNALFWNEGDFHFLPDKLFDHPPPVEKRGRRWDVAAAVVGDFTGDAVPDLLASGRETVFLWVADASGRFTSPPVTVLSSPEVRQPSVLTAGDVDGDGDLDAWLGQYRQPYADGQMPTPY
ncbi:MAG: VCBS repeat-containing protein [Planctomycetia bacterium]|nr:VCBS repeat-containing protein [Planctomycetia bacterium]